VGTYEAMETTEASGTKIKTQSSSEEFNKYPRLEIFSGK